MNRRFPSQMARSCYFRQFLNKATSDNYMTLEKRCIKIIRNSKRFLNEAGWSKCTVATFCGQLNEMKRAN